MQSFFPEMNVKLETQKLPWKTLARIDSRLLGKYVDSEGVEAHKIHCDEEKTQLCNVAKLVESFLDDQYQKSLRIVSYDLVNYIPSQAFSQLGLFAKKEVKRGNLVEGISGFLSELPDSEHIAGVNDFSLITRSTNLKATYLMLGPISFINSSCKPNAKYDLSGSVARCLAVCDINVGDEITVKYDVNFFGNFNEFCLCKHPSKHGDPLVDKLPKRKRDHEKQKGSRNKENKDVPTVKKKKLIKKSVQVDLRHRFKGNVIFVTEMESSSGSSDEEFRQVSYQEIYGSLDCRRDSISSRDFSNSLNLSRVSFELPRSNNDSFVPLAPLAHVCSTPLRDEEQIALQSFEPQVHDDDEISDTPEDYFENIEVELFDGSDFSTNDFFRAFEVVARQNNFTGVARRQVLKLFSGFLPSPNNLFEPVQRELLPSTTTFKDGESSFIAIQLIPQLKKILKNNCSFIKKSWLKECNWSSGKIDIKTNEIYLNMNIDGVALFKSRNFSVWPVWIEVFNLPEKVRSKFENHALLGIWKGHSKPNWSYFLQKIAIEMELFLSSTVFVEAIGLCVFKFLFLICDMPATAAVCLVQQFNGYYGCPYCYSPGIYQSKRMIYPVQEKLSERKNCEYLENARLKRFGVKGISPLNRFFPIPWYVPVDPMHQVFLGSAKVLTSVLISKLKNKNLFDQSMLKCLVPYDSLHKPKTISDLKMWKAADFKLFFFHLGPLLLFEKICSNESLVESF